jgi:UDP-GlcNAc3NAcA epimerase
MKIFTIVGARPQFIKAASVSRILRSQPQLSEVLVHTGQHYDSKMSDIFFQELNIPEPDYNLGVGSGTHGFQTARMLEGIESLLLQEKPDWVLVYGDTNSTVAGAIAAAKLHIPLAHVEAGLRSFNKVMPEEINRVITDRISDLLFAPTQTALDNLANEGLSPVTRFTGDVMYDSVIYYREQILASPGKYLTEDFPAQYILATVHRAENTDNPTSLKDIFSALSDIEMPVVVPIHPRTAKLISGKMTIGNNIRIIEPMGYLEMLKLTMGAHKVITDSGGLQKEAYFLGRPCITIRTETEWVETLHDGWNVITGSNPERILKAVTAPPPTANRGNQFGDGKAAEKIANYLLNQR